MIADCVSKSIFECMIPSFLDYNECYIEILTLLPLIGMLNYEFYLSWK